MTKNTLETLIKQALQEAKEKRPDYPDVDKDGDTIDALIDVGFDIWIKKRIRYSGIDTWESRTRDLEEKAKGLEAKARNKELLMEVSSKSGYFRLKSHGVGKYGRVLGEIFIIDNNKNTICINNQLISEGHAYVYEGGKKKLFTS